ncbi:MAG: phosphoribosylformylglycinamidine synthase I [Candidatus Sungbacteria bacterium]|nr:phosphoribosylformylglycinamidine synthase I [Candidatus Sungbacteria bacterium]
MRPRVCILRTDGTNCDEETAYAFEQAGGRPELTHINQLRCRTCRLQSYEILAIPGGFSYGDAIASGKILAVELVSYLGEEIGEFINQQKLVIGICNGFQVLMRTGLLPFCTLGRMQATLTANDSGHFECRWISMMAEPSPCVFTRNIEEPMQLQVAHGEGKFFTDNETLQKIEAEGLVALRYADESDRQTQCYPANPNGSLNGIAGVCDPTGRIFGLMPHPERFVRPLQHPNWRRNAIAQPHGLAIFRNAVEFAKDM